MRCRSCSHDNPKEARFCGQCGAGLIDATLSIRPRAVPLGTGPVRQYVPKDFHAPGEPSGSGDAHFGDETLAFVGITSKRKVWSVIVAAAAALVGAGALLTFALGGDPVEVGAAEPGAPILIGDLHLEGLARDLDALDPAAQEGLSVREDPTETADHQEDPVDPIIPEGATEAHASSSATMSATTMSAAATMSAATAMSASNSASGSSANNDSVIAGQDTSASAIQSAAEFSAAARRRVADQYSDAIQRCFDDLDTRAPGRSGSVVMAYVLFDDGRVASARAVRNTTGDSTLSQCLVRAASGWRLPAPPARTLEFQMTFSR